MVSSPSTLNRCALLVLQPVLFEYRSAFFEAINQLLPCYLISVLKCYPPGFLFVDLSDSQPIAWPLEVFKYLFRQPAPLVAFVPAYTSHAGIILSTLLLWILRVPLVIHGQALFKKPEPTFRDKIISLFWLLIANQYICYSPVGVEGPFVHSFFRGKVSVALNRFESLDALGLRYYRSFNNTYKGIGSPLRLLFIGRDRPGARLDLAFSLIQYLRNRGYPITLDVVGFESSPREGVTFHGPLPPASCLRMAEYSHIGLYPGDAGLSVLHYMALGLCPVVHGDIRKHSGPEPAYVEDNITGCLFKRSSLDSLITVVLRLHDNPSVLSSIRANARSKALEIHEKPLSIEIYELISPLF